MEVIELEHSASLDVTVTGLRVDSAGAPFLLCVVLLQVWEERTKNRFELKYLKAQLQWLGMQSLASETARMPEQLRRKYAPDEDQAIMTIAS